MTVFLLSKTQKSYLVSFTDTATDFMQFIYPFGASSPTYTICHRRTVRWRSACKKGWDLLLEGTRKGLIYVLVPFGREFKVT